MRFIILTSFLKESLQKINHANLSATDKITNFREALEPFQLQDRLIGYYNANQVLTKFKRQLTDDQVKTLSSLTHPKPLQSQQLFVRDPTSQKIRPVNQSDVKQALQSTINLLKQSNQ